jgi:hypothetical protein
VAAFPDPASADEAWAALEEAGIPASVVTDPAQFGSPEIARVYVEAPNVEAAQAVVAASMRSE